MTIQNNTVLELTCWLELAMLCLETCSGNWPGGLVMLYNSESVQECTLEWLRKGLFDSSLWQYDYMRPRTGVLK